MVALPLPDLPPELSELRSLALNLRWTWNHEADVLWDQVDSELWRRTRNPWSVLQNASTQRLQRLAIDPAFCKTLAGFAAARRKYLETKGWFASTYPSALGGVAYLSMEFGLGAALPLYAGGLGVLAGDYLKTASDLDLPAVGVGLLYQEGYFRQSVDSGGVQHELYPYNEPATMPVEPVVLPDVGWLRVRVNFPGRVLQLRVWQANVGRVKLYLLDSNDPLNSPADRGITAKLYGQGHEIRVMQEIALGIGGWRVIEALHPEVEICHINEGHAALAILERARHMAVNNRLSFWDAFWASRAGNVFTTHTPVAAGFDLFPVEMLRKYLICLKAEWDDPDIAVDDLLALGQIAPGDDFNMAYLAERGSAMTLGVSRLHGEFSREIFQQLFPRIPACEVPIGYVTNGVHMPTWDSAAADKLWSDACGPERWRSMPDDISQRIATIKDEDLWALRGQGRQRLVQIARERLHTQLRERGLSTEPVAQMDGVLDPNILTIGFARRFTEYKRPALLLKDMKRLDALLANTARPIQIVVAGKAHPADYKGKEMVTAWINLAAQPGYQRRVVFLEDYDIALAQELVQGVDVWINTPRRPWEACGTSGMKVLVNGGLNCSIRDGWWDEGYAPELGWAVGDIKGGETRQVDEQDADSLYTLLEKEIVPEFYNRDSGGVPRAWLKRIRSSMAILTPQFAGGRMLRDYVETAYLPLAQLLRKRCHDRHAAAKALRGWAENLKRRWSGLHIGQPTANREGDRWHVSVPVFLGEISADQIHVELFADAHGDIPAEAIVLHKEQAIPGALNGHIYAGVMPASRGFDDYTVRVVPYHEDARLPAELPLIAWQR
jgi:glycogen phosphorylase